MNDVQPEFLQPWFSLSAVSLEMSEMKTVRGSLETEQRSLDPYRLGPQIGLTSDTSYPKTQGKWENDEEREAGSQGNPSAPKSSSSKPWLKTSSLVKQIPHPLVSLASSACPPSHCLTAWPFVYLRGLFLSTLSWASLPASPSACKAFVSLSVSP
jgi:hypothetical protein